MAEFERQRRPSPTYGTPGNGNNNYFEQRRQQRLNSTVSIWPPSPVPSRSPTPEKQVKSHRKDKKSKKRKSDTEDSDDEKARRKRRKKEKKRQREVELKEDDWIEKSATSNAISQVSTPQYSTLEDSDDDIGPKPAPALPDPKSHPKEYGEALLRGEGAAMAAFVADGQRIPRRGEIGLESTEIEKYEKAGYVMSGSRNKKMNAVRMRKENQVITAEEKRAFLKAQQDAKVSRELDIVNSFKEMVAEKLGGSSSMGPSSKQS